MLKETQLCSWAATMPWSAPFSAQPWAPPIAEDNIALLTMSSIMAELSSLWEKNSGRLKATESDNEFYAKRIAYAGEVDDLSHSSPELTAAHRNESSYIINLEQGIFSKLSQKGLTLSKDEKLTPLAALSLVWWLNQEHQPTVDELSAVIYRPENKDIRLQAAILYNHSHYGNRYGEIADISNADLNDWGMRKLSAPENPVSRAVRALRVIHDGTNARPAILQSLKTKLPLAAYLSNGFAPKNAQGSYLIKASPELGDMVLTGCGQIGFDTCGQQDFTQFIDTQKKDFDITYAEFILGKKPEIKLVEGTAGRKPDIIYAVGSLAFSLKTTLRLHYQLQGKAINGLVQQSTEQLYELLLREEEQLHQAGGVRYSPTAIFLSHFSQSNEVEPLTLRQAASVIKHTGGSMDVSHLSKDAQQVFDSIKQLAGNIVAGTAIDVEYDRFEVELKALAQLPQLKPEHPLHTLVHYRLYKSEQEKIQRQLDYLNMRLAYGHLPAVFDRDQAIEEILIDNNVKNIYSSRNYIYGQDPQFGSSKKKDDSPFGEFKERLDGSDRTAGNMSGMFLDVFKAMAAKQTEYYEFIQSHPAIHALAIKTLIDEGKRPAGGTLQDNINALADGYRPESVNARFWRRAWTSLEEHWVCKLPLPNPMCTIARVEGPRSRNENENMAAGMVAMVMEAGQLRGMERGVKLIENPPPGVKPTVSLAPPPRPAVPSDLPVGEGELTQTRQTIPNPRGEPIEVQRVALKDPLALDGMRQAWVRQGGGGAAYWEVDLATGKDLGVVLKEGPEFIKQGRLPGGGPVLSKARNPEFNPEIKLGKKIGSGFTAEIYLDANNPGFVLKKLRPTRDMLLIDAFKKEVEFFNRYYGEGAAELIREGDRHIIRMYRVPGIPLIEIEAKTFLPGAKDSFLRMIDDLAYYNIIHNDLNFNNVLYDKRTNTFHPIDFGDAKDGYYSPSEPGSGEKYWGIKMRVGFILEHIEEYSLS
ncbi:TPA: hypothetical protein ACGBIE_001295 [Yersinia enterocolitica]